MTAPAPSPASPQGRAPRKKSVWRRVLLLCGAAALLAVGGAALLAARSSPAVTTSNAGTFDKWGISFSYPRSMRLKTTESEISPTKKVLVADRNETAFHIKVLPLDVLTVEETQQLVLGGFYEGVRDNKAGAKIRRSSAERVIFDATRSGQSFHEDSRGKMRTTEFYYFQLDDEIYEVVIQFFDEHAETALKDIDAILKSARKTPAKP